ALPDEPGLLAAFVAADVDAVDDDAGNRLQHGPRILRLRRPFEFRGGERRRSAGLLDVDNRRSCRDEHRLRQRPDAQREGDIAVYAGVDDHVARLFLKAREIDGDRVRRGVEVQESELADGVRYGRPRLTADGGRHSRDVDAGKRSALLVEDGSVDVARP